MNEPNKVLKVNSSSLVDLKAELIRKQQEFRKEKAAGGSKSALLAAKRAAHKKVSVFSKKNSGVQERALRDVEEKTEEDNAISRSRSVLEAKAKLYEKMATGGGLNLPDDDEGGRFLVDFQKKSVDDALQKRLEMRRREEEEERTERNKLLEEQRQLEERQKKESEEERNELLQEVSASNDPLEEWVDYTDSLGRSRRCMRKDLPALIQQDKSLVSDDREMVDSSKLNVKEKDLMSADMYREMLREKWEAEQQEMLGMQDTVHYANVRFDEKRTHGVGFYGFAKDEESRQEQLKALGELRTQTLEARKRKEKLKEKRKNMMAARLAKVRQRKMVNNPEADTEEPIDSDDEDFIGPSLSEAAEKPEPELLTRDDTVRRNAPVREWDKGKKDTSAWLDQPPKNPEKSYIESRRDEREAEFAPPQAYYESDNKQQIRNRYQSKREKKDLFSKVDAMTQMDQSAKNTRAEFGPPSDYFTVPVKKPKLNPMASLEKEARANSSVDDVINSGLNSIRAEVEGKSNTGLNISDIPLPPEESIEVTDANQQEDSINHAYQEHELQFYPGQFPGGLQQMQYNAPASSTMMPGPGMPIQPSDHAAVYHYHSDTMPLVTATSNQRDKTMSVEQRPSNVEQNSEEATAKQNTSSLKQAPPTGIISAAPMLYNRAGSRVGAPVKPRYERVHLHEVPLTLPAPPSAANTPHYPSQEDAHQLKQNKQEKDSVKHWLKQYNDNKPKPSTANIPFPSPYVQNEPNKKDLFETAGFDPSKPPPQTRE